ncbi:hypothetical protein A2707_03765 [Candidatus Saccharibacteria bacterium RIFCSPHIGHO2_01_FULL_45_15]|nr:MAG: hypothetical protein A2707_03765 [Candidatus Saccharibacteria bacterium RIFCSPHIGHO2_01_FULL_45_15]OGL31500.1 MAG: hypothetical protein A3E76_03770 [Candidatus Saccharibacteria bacterium RIFCSPHIGHO2_12_FULL_44_22]
MNSFRVLDRRYGAFAMALALLLAFVITSFASAAQVTERSIQLSSASKEAPGVTYLVTFTAAAAAGAVVVDFCSNSPLVGEECTPPVGFDAAAATTSTSGFTVTKTANKVVATGSITQGIPTTLSLDNITNPDAAGVLYARIVTFADNTAATAYTSETPGAKIDEGGVVLSITDTASVSGAVLETLSFCISNATIGEGCAVQANQPPVLKLGEGTGDIIALSPGATSTGTIYTQLTTNAANGAIINLKSATACGGLKRVGTTTCDILPALTGGIADGDAKFGVRTGTVTSTATNAIGTLQPVLGSGYNASTYALNYLSNNTSGITSTYGDPILDTDEEPANDQNMPLIFGASINQNTPAGLYSTDLSLIATGKF